MLNYRLEVFRHVAELQSITKASRVLHLSQPAVTKHIQLLENHLGVPLFKRSANGMVLTPAGLVYLDHVRDVAKAHENIAQQLQHPSQGLAGRLRLGSNKTILSYCLPEIISRFKMRFPSVTCDILDGNTDTIIGALLDHRVDLALIEGPCRRTEIRKEPFFEDDIIWVASPDDPIAKIPHPTVKEILSRPLIVREVGAGSRQFMELALRQKNISLEKLNYIQEVPSPAAIKRIVASGLGISYVFSLSVQRELASGELIKINCPELTFRRPFLVLSPQGPAPVGVAQAFMQVLFEKTQNKNRSD
jgi:DNA-binding transcriptional LysR family regulator